MNTDYDQTNSGGLAGGVVLIAIIFACIVLAWVC